jgi:hypothetical protein
MTHVQGSSWPAAAVGYDAPHDVSPLRRSPVTPMTAPAVSLPPFAALQVALRATTEGLAHTLGRPEASRVAPAWSETEWRVARAVAALHGVSPVLARRLRWQGPSGWQEFLAEQHAQTRARAVNLSVLLGSLDVAARARGLPFVPLKGTALERLGLYEPGERPMADIDLLVRPADGAAMAQVLADLNFRETDKFWKERVFEVVGAARAGSFGESAGNTAKVDLHTHVEELLPRRGIDITALVLVPQLRPGLNPYPSRAALMSHLLLHAANEMLLRTLRLIQLHDLGLLCVQMSEADWEALLALRYGACGLWWAHPPLALLERYYGSVPAAVLAASRDGCPVSLREMCAHCTLTDVSYSNLRRSAFPGISWVQGSAERLAYVTERTWLSVRTLLRPAAPPEGRPAAAAADAVRVRWYGLRPVRPATLNAVRAALGQAR